MAGGADQGDVYDPFGDPTARALLAVSRYRLNSAGAALLDRLIGALDLDALRRIQHAHADDIRRLGPSGPGKYADLAMWLGQKIPVAQALGLDRRPPIDVLDIGTGAGHLPAVLSALGHRVIGTDIVNPLYQSLADLLGVDRRIAPVALGEPQVDFGRRFHLVTIHHQVFNTIGRPDVRWGLSEWRFLLGDLCANQLHPGGAIDLRLNRHSGAEPYPAEFMAWAVAHGSTGDADRGIVHISAIGPGGFQAMRAPPRRQGGFIARLRKGLAGR